MSDRPRRLNNLDCAIAFDYGRLLEETRSKKAGYDELLVALDRAFAQSGVDATTRELLRRCAAAVGLVDRPRQTLLDEIRRLAAEAGVQIRIRIPVEDPQLRAAGIRRPFEMIESSFGRRDPEDMRSFWGLGAQVQVVESPRQPGGLPLPEEFARALLNAGPGQVFRSEPQVVPLIVGHDAEQIIGDAIEAEMHAPAAMRPITAAQRAAEIIEEVNGRACAFCHQRFEPGEHRCPARLGSDPQPSNAPLAGAEADQVFSDDLREIVQIARRRLSGDADRGSDPQPGDDPPPDV